MNGDSIQIVNRYLAYAGVQLQSARQAEDKFKIKAHHFAACSHILEAFTTYCVEIGFVDLIQIEGGLSLEKIFQNVGKSPISNYEFRAGQISELIFNSESWLNQLRKINLLLHSPPNSPGERTLMEHLELSELESEVDKDDFNIIAISSSTNVDDKIISAETIQSQLESIITAFNEMIKSHREYSAEY